MTERENQKYSDDTYCNYDPFLGDEGDLACVTTKIKTAAKDHRCYTLTGVQDHYIRKGDRYRYEKALVDGSFWGEYRICLKCMDEFIGELS